MTRTHPELAVIHEVPGVSMDSEYLRESVMTIVPRWRVRNAAPTNAATMTSKAS